MRLRDVCVRVPPQPNILSKMPKVSIVLKAAVMRCCNRSVPRVSVEGRHVVSVSSGHLVILSLSWAYKYTDHRLKQGSFWHLSVSFLRYSFAPNHHVHYLGRPRSSLRAQ